MPDAAVAAADTSSAVVGTRPVDRKLPVPVPAVVDIPSAAVAAGDRRELPSDAAGVGMPSVADGRCAAVSDTAACEAVAYHHRLREVLPRRPVLSLTMGCVEAAEQSAPHDTAALVERVGRECAVF